MDGIIINTIPFGKKAEHKIFKKYGITIKEEMYRDTLGLREDETIAYWCNKYKWDHINQKDILEQYFKHYIKAVREEGKLMDGVTESIAFFKNKKVKLALASSSYMRQIQAVIDTFRLDRYFDVIHSAEFERHGKPNPDVYITTIKKLGMSASECLAIEDSINGILSAESAGIKCICVPLENHLDDKWKIADIVVPSLSGINESIWNQMTL